MSITNIIEGGSAVGTVPRMGAIQSTLPGPYAANCHHLQALALVKLAAGNITSPVNYVPIPQGSVILDVFLDPIIAPGIAFTIGVGNETGGDTDFGTLSVILASTVRVAATGGTVGANYAGTRGNSVKLTFSALPTALAAKKEAKPEPEEKPEAKKANDKNEKKEHDKHEHEKREHTKHPEVEPVEKPPVEKVYPPAEEPGLLKKGPPYGTYTLEAEESGHALDGPAQFATIELALLMTAMNATTDTLVSISNAHPEITAGSILQIGTEQMQVQRVTDAMNFVVSRGAFATTKAAHIVNSPVMLNTAQGAGAFYGVLAIRYVMT
jgi:hypothetical protein